MRRRYITFQFFLLVACICLPALARSQERNWTNYARIGAYGLTSKNATEIVRDAEKDHVFGIEVDNDIPGRYESLLDPADKLKAIRSVAEAAHSANNKAFVYIAGTECITANADKSAHSVVKDHPDWLQRKITGEPAVFTSGAAFWIRPGDEDVWVSPYAKEWRNLYMQRVRQIAATGIDGIYVDIPYWMTHFDGWEDTWASFDDATVAAFREKTGLDAKKDLKLGDFQNPNFRKWIDFRIETMTDFVQEIRQNAHSVNPQIMVIPEIYPGIEQESTRVGADVYQMYGVVDAVAHEYEFGEGEHLASSRSQLDWFLYQAGMLTFRAFARGKATWILNYSWDGDKNIDPREAMKNLAMSQVVAGANFWDAPGHSMAGSNDKATRGEIFRWIETNEKTFYSPRFPLHPIGVYFSPKSRDYDPNGFLPSFRGLLVLLLQSHQEFQVITPETLAAFHGDVLVLPNVTVLSDAEKQTVNRFAGGGARVVITGRNVTGLSSSERVLAYESCPASFYLDKLGKDFSSGLREMPKEFLQALTVKNEMELDAPSTVAANFGLVDGSAHLFLANFGGLVPGKVATPTPVAGARIRIPAALGNSLAYLPFLGQTQILQGTKHGDKMQFELPAIERGAAIWVIKN
jgi:endo-alpha-1,4-polygalactosaminidase (GH114 family)